MSLEEAELMNKNVPVKEKHFMEGNRAAYVKAVKDFLKKIKEVEEMSEEHIKDFLESYEEVSKEFRKASSRSGSITNTFFGKELSKITTNLNSIQEYKDKCRNNKGFGKECKRFNQFN